MKMVEPNLTQFENAGGTSGGPTGSDNLAEGVEEEVVTLAVDLPEFLHPEDSVERLMRHASRRVQLPLQTDPSERRGWESFGIVDAS